MSDNRLIRGRLGDLMNLKPGQITSVSEEGLKAMNTAVNAPQTILDEAKSAVLGSRHNDYGSCYPLYRKMADVLNALFAHKLKTDEGCTFTAPDMAIIQIVLKICREQYKSKRDNRVDIAGYAEVLDEIQQDIDRMFGGKNAIQDQRK